MHKTIIAVYENHDDAIKAVEELKSKGFGKRHISLVGKLDVDDDMDSHAMSKATKGVGATVILGTTAGVLSGVGLIAIPGLGFLYGAGALVGAIAGFDFGAIAGGVVANLLLDGEKSIIADSYDEQLKAGNTLVVLKTTPEKAGAGMSALEAFGNYSDLKLH
ncbi:MAG: hypothetical protein JSS78_06445 [Bacteroidetes bacterium]|nr:hypothetical protein [Bacteroidota bacterium]